MQLPALNGRLSIMERVALLLLATVPVIFGVLVEIRGAFLKTRHTDLAVFARAAWAIRSGVDVYSITDDKGLHYCYPPLLAIVMTSLADPPPGTATSGMIPFKITVAVWYLLSVSAAFLSVHALANALTESSSSLAAAIGPRWSRGWWTFRVLPLLVCLPYLGHALVIGQVNVFWMAVTCWLCAAILRQRSFSAGLLLAAAICVKVIPAFLLLYPLWKRDGRFLAGAALGLVLGLAVIPAIYLGAVETWHVSARWANVMLLPAIGLGSDLSRTQELLGVWSTHNQALVPILHKTIYILLGSRPDNIATNVQITGTLIGLALTIITLLASGPQTSANRLDEVLCITALCINMLSLSPGGHPHYLLLLVPLIMALMAAAWEQSASLLLTPWLIIFLIVVPFASSLPLIVQRSGICYDLGMPIYSAFLFWGAACVRMWKDRRNDASSCSLAESAQRQSARARAA